MNQSTSHKGIASIVIRTKNEGIHLESVLRAVLNQTVTDIDIILVDSGSSDNTLDIARRFPKVCIFEIPPSEFTFGHAINYGMDRARGVFGVLLSGHSIPNHPTWLEELLKPLQEDPNLSGTFSRQLPHAQANLLEKFNCTRTYSEKNSTVIFSNAASAFRLDRWRANRFNEVVGANEDFLWAKAELKAGYQVMYCPQSTVLHSHDENWRNVAERIYRERTFTERHPPLFMWKLRILKQEIYYSIKATAVFLSPVHQRNFRTHLGTDFKYYLHNIAGHFYATFKLILYRHAKKDHIRHR